MDTSLPHGSVTQQSIDEFSSIALSQRQKGLSKYGVTLDERTAAERDWSKDVKEELVDAFQYIVMLERERNYWRSRYLELVDMEVE